MIQEPAPDELQQADIIPVRILVAISKTTEQVQALTETIKALTEMLASHIRANIENSNQLKEYMNSQMQYRSMREDLEEQKLKLEIEQKNIEVQYLERRINFLTEENTDADRIRLDYEKQKLELQALKDSREILQQIKGSTKDKLKPPAAKLGWDDVKRAVVLGAVGTLTASLVGGSLAFVVWGLRQWLLSTP